MQPEGYPGGGILYLVILAVGAALFGAGVYARRNGMLTNPAAMWIAGIVALIALVALGSGMAPIF